MEVVAMLVLTRKCQESVVVGAAKRLDRLIKVTVMEIREGKVKLGFEAADDVPAHRLEVWERILAGGLLDGSIKSLATPVARGDDKVGERHWLRAWVIGALPSVWLCPAGLILDRNCLCTWGRR